MIKLNLLRSSIIPLPIERPSEWVSHMMAPAPSPVIQNGKTEIFVGGWNSKGISSIYSFQFDLESLEMVLGSCRLELQKGDSGAFDENGVFPASIIDLENTIALSYTGFQLGQQIPHFNFGGLAVRNEQNPLMHRISKAPILDRADEGLTVRAGLSAIRIGDSNNNEWLSVYASGSTFEFINGKMRPNYSVFSQFSHPLKLQKSGRMTVPFNDLEHGVGRPYLISYENLLLLFFTRRLKDFNYLPGLSISDDQGETFHRFDHILENVTPRLQGFDNEMQYFPAPLIWQDKLFVFYNGNNFGQNGMGVWEFQFL